TLGPQSSTFQGRLRFQATALNKSFCLRLPLGRRALARRRLFPELTGLLCRATDAKPLAHQLQMTVDLSRVIALSNKPKVALDHVRCTSLAFLARHPLPFAGESRTPCDDGRLYARMLLCCRRRIGADMPSGRCTGQLAAIASMHAENW